MTRLSPDEIKFFKMNGYLIKRRVMDEKSHDSGTGKIVGKCAA